MDYLRWAKLHRRVSYELTASGVPGAGPADIDTAAALVGLEVNGAYGDPELIDAIAERYQCPPEHVVPVAGASSANFIALAASVERHACVAVEYPVYEPIARVASFLELRVLRLRRLANTGFAVSEAEVDAALGLGARAIVITNLHNPSGQLLDAPRVEAIAARCRSAGAILIVDEAYLDANHLIFGGPLWTAAAVAQDVVACNSLTKVYGLGGLRVGWLVTNTRLAERARRIMDLLSVDNAAPSASLALCALSQAARLETRYRLFYGQAQPVYRRWLADEPLVSGYESHGALFEFVRLPDGVTGDRLNDILIARYDTQVVPGRFFGQNGHIRVSLALPPGKLAEGLARIGQAISALVRASP